MAINTDKLKEDASGILNILGKNTPFGVAKMIAKKTQGNEAQIMKFIKKLLKSSPPGLVVDFIADRYKIPKSIASRMVVNEMADANMPTDASGSADDNFPSRPEFESSAEDTSVMPIKNRKFDMDVIKDRFENRFEGGEPIQPLNRFEGGEPIQPLKRFTEEEILNRFKNIDFSNIPSIPLLEGKIEDDGLYDNEKKYYPDNYDSEPRFLNQGGRVGYQEGGITEQRQLPPEYIEAAQKTFLADLTRQSGIPSITTANTQQAGETPEQFAARQAQAQQFGITKAGMADLAPQVAAQDPLQTAAYAQAVDPTTGLGAYQPFLADAGTAATGATALTGTGAGTGAGSISSYMSPYQTSVIDTTLAEFDRQAQAQKASQAAQALGIPGAFGGGREGVLQSEYALGSDRNRAALQSGLLQQGFQQGQSARQQDFSNQLGLANLQSGLGARAQDFSRAQISGLGTLGAQQQAQSQAILDAQRQTAQMAVDDPRRRLSMLGAGITQLTPGAGAITLSDAQAAPSASPLTTALGLGLAGADIYGRIFKPK